MVAVNGLNVREIEIEKCQNSGGGLTHTWSLKVKVLLLGRRTFRLTKAKHCKLRPNILDMNFVRSKLRVFQVNIILMTAIYFSIIQTSENGRTARKVGYHYPPKIVFPHSRSILVFIIK